MVKVLPVLTHPDALIVTVNVALYVAPAAPAGTTRTMGVAGSAAFVTLTKFAEIAAAS